MGCLNSLALLRAVWDVIIQEWKTMLTGRGDGTLGEIQAILQTHFGRKTSRRNSLRKKLTDHQKVRQNPTPLNPVTDIQNPNDSLEKFENLSSGSTKQSDVDNDAGELKSKRLGESVLLSKLENWLDQYKKDAEFWGIGSGPVFTVSQDVEGNVKGVRVHEDEILKRLELEDMKKVNSRILYAKNLAREMETGENVIPRTSSVAKFVVSKEESGFMSGIRGVILHPGFIPKLSSVGTLLLGGLIIVWASKLFVSGKRAAEYTPLEKEMMRRKIRPRLDKRELMNNILKAKAATDKLALLDSSGSQSSKSRDFEGKIEEIKWMAKKARETEAREQSGVGKEEKEVQAANKEFSDEMEPAEEDGKDCMIFLSNPSIEEDFIQAKGNHNPNGVDSLDSRVRQVIDASSGDKESMLNKENDEECKENVHQQPLSSSQKCTGKSKEQGRSAKTENWIENNFMRLNLYLKRLEMDLEKITWLLGRKLVRENELSGRDPFYLMDAEEKLAFFQGLEKKVEKENEKLSHLHEWLHSNIEILIMEQHRFMTYDSKSGILLQAYIEVNDTMLLIKSLVFLLDGISLHDPPEKIIPRWKGPPLEKSPEFLSNFQEQRKALFNGKVDKKDSKILSKAVMVLSNLDLDRWITEKEIQEAADLMKKLPERNKKFMEKKLNKLKREMKLFGPQAVVSKYQEYAEDKEEDYLWWLDLPQYCVLNYTFENDDQRIGFYALEMAADLELEPKPHHVIAFEDAGDCKFKEYKLSTDLITENRPKKHLEVTDAFREAKANGFGVTVIRKGELRLNVDQTLEEVEEEICEIGSKIYHDKIMRERSVDISSLMKGMLGVGDKPRRR
ncbi:EMB1703 protein [Hibiscus syriacus]|uniref:EMB1703 protein n=1 Tax=Hibiscus syriacus TaxID=106335 RepID=A0A6A2ZZU5_HIBSY|nr:EMB1703 protein [Hibiscus syriacus]